LVTLPAEVKREATLVSFELQKEQKKYASIIVKEPYKEHFCKIAAQIRVPHVYWSIIN
jgi:predicted YcjX-like family ATPase